MDTLDKLLDTLSERAGSDRKIAPMLGVAFATISAWRTRRAFPEDDQAVKLAELLKMPDEYVLAVVRSERTKSERAKKAWRRIAAQFRDAAVVAVVAVGAAVGALTPSPAQAGFNNSGIGGNGSARADAGLSTHCAAFWALS